MLSPAKWYRKVPTDRLENLKFRLWLLNKCSEEQRFRTACMEACRQDIFFFINAFVWQINPKHIGSEVGPFVCWDFQKKAIRQTMDRLFGEYPDDMLWEKSREMGATWMALIMSVWLCLFHHNKRVLCISHSEQAVDRAADAGTLFAKVAFILEYLPDWMKSGTVKRKMGFRFSTGSTISGAASTGRSGVGDRVTMVLLDEFSKQREGYEIWGQTADTGPRLVIGTHYGTESCYYDLSQDVSMKKIVLHWLLHPEKNKGRYRYNENTNQIEVLDKDYEYPQDFRFVMTTSPRGGPHPGIRTPWYDRECLRRKSDRDVACHLDINPSGAMSRLFDEQMIHLLINTHCREPYWRGEVVVDQSTGKLLELLPHADGPLLLWLNLLHGQVPPVAPYTMGGDISYGTKSTPSCISIVNARTGEKVGEYANPRIQPNDLAAVATALAWTFQSADGSPARLCWEQQGPGVTFGARVIELGFRNIYYRTSEPPHTMRREISDRPGWVNNSNEILRELLVAYMVALKDGLMVNRSEPALKECLLFRFNASGDVEHSQIASKNDPQAARVNHADRVIADALAWKMAKALRVQVKPDAPPPVEELPFMSLGWMRERERLMRSDVELWAD